MATPVYDTVSDIFEALHRDEYLSYMQDSTDCPDDKQKKYQHIFYSEQPEIYFGVTIDDTNEIYEYRLSVRDEQKSYQFESVKSFLDSVTPVVKVLTSKYLHNSNLTAFKYLIGFNEEEELLYAVGDHLTVETIHPKEEAAATIMEEYPNTRESVELGDLKGISPRTVYSHEKEKLVQIGSIFVFEGGLVTINTSSEDISNDVTPFVYDSAYIDYISSKVRRGWTEWDYLDEDMIPEVMGQIV